MTSIYLSKEHQISLKRNPVQKSTKVLVKSSDQDKRSSKETLDVSFRSSHGKGFEVNSKEKNGDEKNDTSGTSPALNRDQG